MLIVLISLSIHIFVWGLGIFFETVTFPHWQPRSATLGEALLTQQQTADYRKDCNEVDYTFFTKTIFHSQLNTKRRILVLLKSVYTLPLIFRKADFYSYFEDHTEGTEIITWVCYCTTSKVKNNSNCRFRRWKGNSQSVWPPCNFILFNAFVFKPFSSHEVVTVIHKAKHDLFQSYFMFVSLISSPHIPADFSLCSGNAESLAMGLLCHMCTLHPGQQWHSHQLQSFCDAPTKIIWKSEQDNGRCHKDQAESYS